MVGWAWAIQEITPALAKSFKLPDQRKGVLISDVNENGPSHTAGMRRGDVVLTFNGKEVQSVSQLRNLVARMTVGKGSRHQRSCAKARNKSSRSRWRNAHRMKCLRSASQVPLHPQTETVKPPDNVLAALRVQMLDAAMQKPTEHSRQDQWRGGQLRRGEGAPQRRQGCSVGT